MKNILFLSTILFFISSCNESNLSEVPSAHQIPKAGKALQSSFISGLQPWEARRVSEIASNGQEILLSYSDNNTTKAIPLNNSNNETPVTLSSFNFKTSRLLERHTSLRTRSGASDSSVIQLPDSGLYGPAIILSQQASTHRGVICCMIWTQKHSVFIYPIRNTRSIRLCARTLKRFYTPAPY